jgi:hypothetical protein
VAVKRSAKWNVNYAVRKSATMPPPSRLIMLVLSDIADAGTAETPPKHTPSLAELAAETGHGLATVKRHLTDLEDEGWLTRIRPTEAERVLGGRTRYRLHVPAHGSQRANPVGSQRADLDQGSAHSDTGVGSQRANGSAHSGPSTYNYQDNQNNHSSSAADAADDTPPKRAPKTDPLLGFDAFWSLYPKKVGKEAAKRAYAKALKAGTDPKEIIDGAQLYALDCRMVENPHYIKHPQGWLNDGRWADDRTRAAPPLAIGAPSVAARGPENRSVAEVLAQQAAYGSEPDEDWPPREPDDEPWDATEGDPYAEPPF